MEPPPLPSRRPSHHIGTTHAPINTSHLQDGPRFGNSFLEDSFLTTLLDLHVPHAADRARAQEELTRLGQRTQKLWPIAKQMDDPNNLPRLIQYDGWGHRVDDIKLHYGWRHMHDVAAEEGLIADAYDRAAYTQESRRLVQFSKIFLFAPVSGLYTCPLAMTDGAARVLEICIGGPNGDARMTEKEAKMYRDLRVAPEKGLLELARSTYQRLTSRSPSEFYTSGQWMTERGGGSDVAQGTETIARKQSDGSYKLFGYKWFSSATDADVALTLARIEDEAGTVGTGTGGLSCFLVKLRDDETGRLYDIRVAKLKNKLGTKQLPTGELELNGTRAHLISHPGRGVAAITHGMVNITRVHNAVNACQNLRRVASLARDYADRRVVFGSKLSENALHLRGLAKLEVSYRACLSFTFQVIQCMGRVESGEGGEEEELVLRLMTPALKAYTAKQSVSGVSEGLEMFGGAGYLEDTGIPGILRDAQVLTIWEGTTNVLSHDVLRVLMQTKGRALAALARVVARRCGALDVVGRSGAAGAADPLSRAAAACLRGMEELTTYYQAGVVGKIDPRWIEADARELMMSLARVYAGSSLVELALRTKERKDALVAARFCAAGEAPLVTIRAEPADPAGLREDRELAMDLDPASGVPRGVGNVDPRGMARARL